METEVGSAAGLIWNYLAEHGKTDALKLKLNLGLTNSILFLALGWLLRENKLVISKEKNLYYIELKKTDSEI
ncbi:MAG: winged helix-turn-helix domain-containing protein [Elusimicrobiota bacterium]|nr:winged helix-turn-helix domain-containing protein [Elusimicrobiota bacterium]